MSVPDIQAIISIFRDDLKMRVTDNHAKAKASIDAQTPSKAKDAGSPDPVKAKAANDWFTRTTPLLNLKKTFDEYVGAVRKAVDTEFMASVTSIQSTGGKIDDDWISVQIKGFADRYYLEEEYAKRIVDESNIAIHVELAPVADLKADFDMDTGGVTLTWTNPNPSKLWGAIEIVRSDLKGALPLNKINDFSDDSVVGGQRYRYTVTVVGKDGTTKSSPATTEVLCIAEVSGFVAAYHGDKKGFALEWNMPQAATDVHLYRVDGDATPKTSVGKSGPVVPGGRLILQGKKSQCLDTDVLSGKTYTYVIFAGYGGGQFSPKGACLTLTVPAPPDPVDRLTGSFDQTKKRVHLEWHNPNPPDRWDSVIVRRRESGGKYVIVSRGKISQLDDSGVEAGGRYAYEVRVVQGDLQSPARMHEVICVCPVSGFGGEYHGAKGEIALKWHTPRDATAVFLYRVAGKDAPAVSKQGDKLVATNGDLPLLTSRSDSYTDSNIRLGTFYTYLAFADFGHGMFSTGVTATVNVPLPPAPPPSAAAEFDTNSIRVDWEGSNDSNVRYRIYRKTGVDAPVSPTDPDGKLLGETEQMSYRDQDVVPGAWYAYSVFSVRGDQFSTRPASTTSIGALFALADVDSHAQGNVVHIKWKATSSAACVLVAAADGAPPKQFIGVKYHRAPPGADASPPVKVYSKEGFFSEHVDFGSTRGYLLACAYTGPDGKSHVSKKFSLTIRVDHPLGTIEDFSVSPNHNDQTVTCRWATNGVGQFMIFCLPADHGLVRGSEHDLVALAALRGAKPQHIASGEREWQDLRPDASRPWYCSVLMSPGGNKVRIGPSHRVGVVPRMQQLSIKRKGNGVAITFDWPTSVDFVEVKARFSDRPWPTPIQVFRHQYDHWGNEVRLFPREGEGLYEYEVTPCRGDIHGESCRIQHPWIGVPRQLYVSWQPSRSWLPRRAGIHFSWRLYGDPLPPGYQFGGVRLLANPNGVPLNSRESDTRVLAQLPDGVDGHSTTECLIPYSEIARHLGDTDSAFFRAELVVPEQDHGNVLLVQCGCSAVPLHLKTRRFVGEDKQSRVRRYTSKATDFLCPHCWKKYPVREMLYADSDQLPEDSPADNFRQMTTGIARLLGTRRPPGRFNYCPGKHKHLLGKFTGAVSDQLIGLLGSSSSGKTYYVASILAALHEHPDNGMDALLSSLGEATRTWTPTLVRQYLSGTPLPKTPPGKADYRNYLLTVLARHWFPDPSRNVLFSVQDTGGENMQGEAEMRKSLPYLDFCSGLILVVDPLQFPKIRQRLRGVVPLPTEQSNCRTQDIVGRLRIILAEKQQHEIPLALVITKCDVLLEHGLLSDVNLWGWENTTKRQRYSWDHHNDITGLFAAFMQEHEPSTYREAIDQFPIHAFFGVSATGTSEMKKDAEGNDRFVRIEPRHVLEPIWWLLATMDMIKTSRLDW